MPQKVLLCWSSGKDSALALHELLGGGWQVVGLLNTVTEDYDRVSMHGVRRGLVEAQARAAGLPLETVLIRKDASNQDYERQMRLALAAHSRRGVRHVAFGDIFLEDLRKYRQEKLAAAGMEAVFPLWGRSTAALAGQFEELGFRAVVTCVDTQRLDAGFAGRQFDGRFVADLPAGVDPCGENGEFHTFAWSGPVFGSPIEVATGRRVLRENRFCFCDLELACPQESLPQLQSFD